MSDGYMKYNYASIGGAVEDIRRFCREMDDQLEQVESKFNSLQDWEGLTKGTFNTCKEQWNKNARELTQSLLEIANILQTGSDNMQSTDKRLMALFDS